MEIEILSSEGKAQGKAELPGHISQSGKLNRALLHEVVTAYLANQRKGTHSALTRAEVSGGGKKPWKQKHTGRARAGSSRSPLWRGGGIIFGPKPRSYRRDIPQEKIKISLYQVINEKAVSGNLVVSEMPALDKPKTKLVSLWLKKVSASADTLLVMDKKNDAFALASRNLDGFSWIECKHLHPYHIMHAGKVIMTPEAVKCL